MSSAKKSKKAPWEDFDVKQAEAVSAAENPLADEHIPGPSIVGKIDPVPEAIEIDVGSGIASEACKQLIYCS